MEEERECEQLKETCADLSNKDAAWLRVATSLAATSECRQRHGAIIVSGGSLIAGGTNRDRNHPRVLGDDRTINLHASYHAEHVALAKLDHVMVPRATLYVARINPKCEPMMSRPCNNCWNEIRSYGIKEVIYTTSCTT